MPTVSASQVGYNYPTPINSQYAAPTRYIDLQAVNQLVSIAPNFTLDEIAQEWKGRYAVVQPHAIDRLQDLRDSLGALVVNSGYRNPSYNSSIGGATSSRHMYGDAFDLDPVSASLSTLESTCYANGAGYVGVYPTHMHCDWRSDPTSPVFYGSSSTFTLPYIPDELEAEIVLDTDGTLTTTAFGWDEGAPLREWVAFDEDGYSIQIHLGSHFDPPPEAVSVEVWVGRALVRSFDLSAL